MALYLFNIDMLGAHCSTMNFKNPLTLESGHSPAMRHIVESSFGYTLRMIRDNADRATFLGINVFRVRLMAFMIAGVFAAIGGMVMALFVSGDNLRKGAALNAIQIAEVLADCGPRTGG